MPTTFFTNAWTTLKARILYRGATAPTSTKYYFCLANTSSATRSSTAQDFFGSELLTKDGYTRFQVNYAADGSFNNTTLRHEMALITASWTAANASLIYQTGFLAANAHARSHDPFTSADVNTSTDTITLTGHLLANGDIVRFEPAVGGTLPTPLAINTNYYAVNVVAGTSFKVSLTSGGSAVDLTAAGSGNLRLRYATGTIVFATVEDAPVTVAVGRQLDYDLYLTEQAATYGNGI